MSIKKLQKNWDSFGEEDPLWAIVSWPEKKGNKWEVDEFFETGAREIDSIMNYIRSLGIDLPRRRAFDFGCGVGRSTQALAMHFGEVTGVDIAPSMLKLAEKYNRHGDRCKYRLNEVKDLKLFKDDTFDFVYSNIVLQHMKPPYSKSYITELLRVLAPGGILIFQLPSVPWEARTSVQRFMKRLIPEPFVRAYRSVRHGRKGPVIEMYGVPKEHVLELLGRAGAKVLGVVQNESAGPGWTSFQYCATKPRPAHDSLKQ